MAAQYAPLPFSYISAGVKAPKTGLRKDEGLYGKNEHIVRDIPPFDSSQASLALGPHENGAFSSATSIEEPSITVNPLYGALVQQPVGGLPRQHKQQPELPQSKHQPTLDNQYRLRNSGSDNQIREDQLYSTPIGRTLSENSPKDQTYGNLQDHELNVYSGLRNHPQPQVAYGKPQQSKMDVGISSADVNANVQKNVRVSSFPPITDTTGFEYDSVPRMLAPTVPVGMNNTLSQLQYGVAAYPPRQNPTSTYAVGPNQTGPTSQAVFVARPAAGTEIPKPSEFAFERPDFSLYAGNVQREPETTSSTVDVRGGVSYPLQPIKTPAPTTVTSSYNRPKSDRHRESGCCGLKTACIILAIIFVALVCLGAGFVAGWFGRQAALGDTSTVSGSSYSTSELLLSMYLFIYVSIYLSTVT